MEQVANVDLARLKRVRDWRIVLPVFLVSIIACIDRVNLAYAKLTMTADLPWITPEVFGMGAGIFFVGYLIFEIPGSLVASHFSATKWIARIMFTWGLVCIFMAFVTTEFQFFLCRKPAFTRSSTPCSSRAGSRPVSAPAPRASC